ncbi:MAG: hypothetical protein VKO65_09530 [Cyanobacteriota bacterium]|nr:hypothetical protein [Cyanobacteriota bacterium]
MQRRLLPLAWALALVCQAGAAQAQLIRTCGQQIATSLRAAHPQLIVDDDDRFIFDRPSSGIQLEHIRLAVRWRDTDPWTDCVFGPLPSPVNGNQEDMFDCPSHFRMTANPYSEGLEGDGPGVNGTIALLSRNNVVVWSDFVSGSLVQCSLSGAPVRQEPDASGRVAWERIPHWKVPVVVSWIATYRTGARQENDPRIQYQIRYVYDGFTVPLQEKATF